MTINITHASTQRDNNDDNSPHNQGGRGHDGHRDGHDGHGGRGSYGERFGNDNVVDNHNRNDHNRRDHYIEEGGRDNNRGSDCNDDRRCGSSGGSGRCSPKCEPPVVLAPIVAVAAGTTVIGAFPDRVAIQILNNAALIATYTVVLQMLPECETGYVVIETGLGITALSVQGPVSNVSAGALTTAGSSIVLKWNGFFWVQV